MSNLSDLLKSVGAHNSDAVGVIGNAIGTLADFSGGVEAIKGVIDQFISDDDQTNTKLAEIQTILIDNFKELNARDRAIAITQRESDLNAAFSKADSVMSTLESDVNADPPLPWAARSDRIEKCVEAADLLADDEIKNNHKWLTFFNDEIYYTDFWSGLMSPEPDANLEVFTDRYVLPDYMRVLNIFLLVISVFDPDFKTNYRDWLKKYANRLYEAHEISRGGIRLMAGPSDETAGFDSLAAAGNESFIDGSDWCLQKKPASYNDDGIEYYQIYGVVHTYSGYSDYSKFPPIPNPFTRDIHPFEISNKLFQKLGFADHYRWKEVYKAIGLTVVWDTINKLLQVAEIPLSELTGNPLLAFDLGRWWSLKETRMLLDGGLHDEWDDPGIQWPPIWRVGPISGKDTIRRLTALSGLETDPQFQPTLSWRNALNPAMLRDKVTNLERWWFQGR